LLHFGKEFIRTGKLDAKFHRYLLDSQDTRNVGDYGIGPGVRDEQVRDALVWAEELIISAEALLLK
jgi:uncharacterized protein (UPF0332 family)